MCKIDPQEYSPDRIKSCLHEWWANYDADVRRLAEDFGQEVLQPFCNKHDITFSTDSGEWLLVDADGNEVCEDNAKSIGGFDILDALSAPLEFRGYTFGYLVPDYSPANYKRTIEAKNQRICDQLVRNNVGACASYIIAEIAKLGEEGDYFEEISQLQYVEDWETPIREHLDAADLDELQHAAHMCDSDISHVEDVLDDDEDVDEDATAQLVREALLEDFEENEDWQQYCLELNLDPETCEVYEHWIVDSWFAGKLQEHGHTCQEICGLWIWGRPTTGQAIMIDGVIRDIASSMEILCGQANEWKCD